MGQMPLRVRRLLPTIRGLILDVDGVLTDGRLSFGLPEEIKSFHVRDGHGLVLLLRAGFFVGIISGRSGAATKQRLDELGIKDYHLGVRDKSHALDTILSRWKVSDKEIGIMGDDITDLPLFKRAGLSITVSDAHPTVLRTASWVTRAPGGLGAAREVSDALLFVNKRRQPHDGEEHRC